MGCLEKVIDILLNLTCEVLDIKNIGVTSYCTKCNIVSLLIYNFNIHTTKQNFYT